MTISFRKYIDITSGVGAGVAIATRELLCRLFTTNELVPTATLVEFDTADEVGDYFGLDSEEYARAAFYFAWISKNITSPRKIAFARWADVATAPQIFGVVATQSLSAWQGISDGAFTITLGATTHTIDSLDFSAVTTLADVAAIVQTGIRAETGSMWTAAVVSWDATRGSFNFTGGVTGAAVISTAAPGTGTNILTSGLLGWNSLAIFSDGAALETAAESAAASAEASTNFGSFLFMPDLTLEEATEVATWNATQNNTYMFLLRLEDSAEYQDYCDALIDFAGVGVTYAPLAAEYPEMIPGMVLAATDYNRANSVQNYMYQQASVTASVSTDSLSDAFDTARINYYGVTQTAGQQISFYQRGLLMGGSTAPVDMNVFANEMWLKDFIAADLMEMFLALGRVSANAAGRGTVLTVVQTGIDAALRNGTISQGKTLTTIQKLYISQVTNDPEAWRQVQDIGYWVDCVIEPEVIAGRTEYVAKYTLVYSKDDAIRKVEGTHILI